MIPKLKFCGLHTKQDIEYVNACQPDFAGFIFARSIRQVTPENAGALRKILSPRIPAVGVFVNEPNHHIISLAKQHTIQLIQLHGEETKDDILLLKKETGLPVIKAIRVTGTQEITNADLLPCDYLLFDTYQPNAKGGTGTSFDWTMIPTTVKHPFFIAGGLNPSNIHQAASHTNFGLDISSGIETDGHKDYSKMHAMIRTCHGKSI